MAQARFERRRIRHLPVGHDGFGGSCDEVVGRICVTFGEGEWYPRPEDRAIVRERRLLLARLDSLQRLAPRDSWILGQRVWYRSEAGDWESALRVASGCRMVERETWWCRALAGFALHGLGRYEEAERAFRAALETMEPERAERWRVPRWPVDGGVRDLLEEALEEDAGGSGERGTTDRVLRRLWALADPLWMVEGNDRKTAHMARWTAAEIRREARNPFRLTWADDLTELTVRHGWQEGWERIPARSVTYEDRVIGHDHPLSRDYMPSGEVMRAPAEANARELAPDPTRPRSLHAPAYAPVLLPMEGQLAVFPRLEGMVVVATHFLPGDTTFHAGHGHPRPWLAPGDQAGMPDRTGLFALPVGDLADGGTPPAAADGESQGAEAPGDGDEPGPLRRSLWREDAPAREDRGAPLGVRAVGSTEGALLLQLPHGDHVVSAESWSPRRCRAGRRRVGVGARRVIPDVASLSDILVLRPSPGEPSTVEEALGLALPRARLAPGEALALGWEVAGLGFRDETLVFQLSVAPAERGVLHRIGDFLGLSAPPSPLLLSWEEPAPDEPGHRFHYLALDVPELEEGTYRVRLVLRTAGRSDAVTVSRLEVVPGG